MSKKKVAFVTDSTVFLTEELRNHADIYVVPIVVIADGQELEDGKDLKSEKLYHLIRTGKEVPKTSQPNVAKFSALYEKLKEEYESAIAIHVSGKLSGTISSSSAAKDQVGFHVEIVDSNSLSFTITELIETGLELAEQGVEVSEIAAQLRKKAKHHRNLIILGSLEQLYKGGRMSGAQFLLGNFLKIKPILSISTDGELKLLERIRSEKKAFNRIVELVKQAYHEHQIKQIGIMHGNAIEKAMNLKERFKLEIPALQTVIGDISSSLAVHAGEGSIAVFWNEYGE